eukprot:3051433-Prymnesium_polylepis.1
MMRRVAVADAMRVSRKGAKDSNIAFGAPRRWRRALGAAGRRPFANASTNEGREGRCATCSRRLQLYR